MAGIGEQAIGGYDVTLVSLMPKKYKCPICNFLMRDVIQTYRGEMACELCYRNAKGTSNICPIDGEPTEEGEFFNDMHARREILQLPCYCPNKITGCSWQGVINEIQDHTINCLYKEISCTKCHDLVIRKDIEYHEKELCRFRSVNCCYCEKICDAQSLQEHESSCQLKPMECPYQCGQPIAQKDMYGHVQNCPIISSGAVCPYQVVGCKHKPKNAADLMDHLQIECHTHAAFSVSLVMSLKQSHEQLRQDLMSEQAVRTELALRVEEQAKEKSHLASEVDRIQGHLYDVQSELTSLHEKCDISVTKVKEDLKEIDLHTQQNSLQEIDKKLTEIGLKYADVEEKLKLSGTGTGTAVDIKTEDIEEGMNKIDRIENGNAVLSANLSDLELKLQLLENTTYEGAQLWKVDNVSYRTSQAVTGKVTALHSAPCFQRRGGYKFCSRLYLNGDGMGRGTHVSLFFVVMKSEYDSLLEWPFRQRVTFKLVNPTNPAESVQESFLPDQNSSSFKRPTKDMNIAAGCPLFVRKERLQQFIIDDCIYIETSIGGDEIPVTT